VYAHPQLRSDLSHELRRGLDDRAAMMAAVDEARTAGRARARLVAMVPRRRRRTQPIVPAPTRAALS
jgi:hypothetical protein